MNKKNHLNSCANIASSSSHIHQHINNHIYPSPNQTQALAESPLVPDPGKINDHYKIGPIIAQDMQSFFKQVVLLRKLDHPNIMRVYQFYEDTKFIYLVQEFCDGFELFQHIQQRQCLSEVEAARVMRQLLSALNYSHSQKIVHRDLKPENILYELQTMENRNNHSSNSHLKSQISPSALNFVIKIIDWGTARDFTNLKELNSIIGAPYYIAPEVLDGKYSEKCDLWSSGVILYIMLSGYPPFPGATNSEIVQKVYNGKFEYPEEQWNIISDQAKDLINKLLDVKESSRLSAKQALCHDWFSSFFNTSTNQTSQFHSEHKRHEQGSPDQKIMKVMKQYRAAREDVVHAMKKLLATHIGVNAKDRKQLIRIFQQLDKDGDGRLSRDELLSGYQNIHGEKQGAQIADEVMNQVDIDRSGYIDYSEFVIATLDPDTLISKKTLRNTFRLLDRGGTGYISILGLKNLLIRDRFLKKELKRQENSFADLRITNQNCNIDNRESRLLDDIQQTPFKARANSPMKNGHHTRHQSSRGEIGHSYYFSSTQGGIVRKNSPTKLLTRSKWHLQRLMELVGQGNDQLVTFTQFSELMKNLFKNEQEEGLRLQYKEKNYKEQPLTLQSSMATKKYQQLKEKTSEQKQMSLCSSTNLRDILQEQDDQLRDFIECQKSVHSQNFQSNSRENI